MRSGRRFWVIVDYAGVFPFAVGPLLVLKFMRFLPRGVFEKNGRVYNRKQSLIEVYTDPGGIRVLAAADIRFRDPQREVVGLQIARR